MSPLAVRRWRLRHLPPAPRGRWSIPDDPERFDLFLLMGQSNMAGFGCVRADDPWLPGDFEAPAGVLALGGQGTLDSKRPRGPVRWRPAAHPLHLNQRSAGFGPGLPFAEALREDRPDRGVGLIPCAWGGAPIDRLGRGSEVFENALMRARVAARRGRLRGVLWHQGESDTESDELAASHAEKLVRLIADLRRETGQADLAFLIGDLGEFMEARRRTAHPAAAERIGKVRRGLREVAEADPHAAFVGSDGLAGVDAVHFGRAAVVDLGGRYAAAWGSLRRG